MSTIEPTEPRDLPWQSGPAGNSPKTVEDYILADDLRELGAVSMADAIDEAEMHGYVDLCRWYLRKMIDPGQ